MKQLTHGGLFSGILGFSEGFRRAGIRSLWECEWDAKCQDVIRRQEPSIKVHPDVTTFNADDFECPDIISFGFPCTDISIAGKRAGVIDGQTRSGLFYEATRIISRFVPRGLQLAIAENVGGLFSHNEGRTFVSVIGTLGELGAMDIGWATLDSQWFGLAQRRERVFIVVDFRARRAGEILSLAEGLCWHSAPRRQAGKSFAADIAPSLRASGCGSHRIGDQTGQDAVIAEVAATLGGGSRSGGFGGDTDRCGAFIPVPTHEITPCLAVGTGTNLCGENAFVVDTSMGLNGAQDPIYTTEKAQALVSNSAAMCVAFQERCFADNRTRASGAPNEIAPPLTAQTRSGDGHPCVAFQQNQSGDVYTSEVVGTLNTNQNASGRGTPKIMMPAPQYRVRRLTPTECARLQGFPDDWNNWLSDSARYAQFGNAVSVPVTEWLGRRVVKALTKTEH